MVPPDDDASHGTFRQQIKMTYGRYPVLVIAIVALFVLNIFTLVGGAIIIKHVNDNKVGLDTIQQERANSIIRQCNEQNENRSATVIEYDKRALRLSHLPVPASEDVNVVEAAFKSEIKRLPKAAQANALTGHEFTLALVNRLAPRRDCFLAAKRFAPSATPSTAPPTDG